MSYDPKCFTLAAAFLADEHKALQSSNNTKRLAQAIQDTIEGEMEDFLTLATERQYSAFLDGFQTVLNCSMEIAIEQWQAFSRQLSDDEREDIELDGEEAGRREGAAFIRAYGAYPKEGYEE